jgi:hypothetical protein
MGSLAGGLVAGGLGLVGGILGGRSAEKAAGTSAAAQLEAARIAAEAQKFRPVGVTTGFGSSQFTTDSEGNVTGAGYTLTPELQAIRNRLVTQAGAYDPTQIAQQAQALGTGAQSLFGAGQGYLSASPEEARQRYISQQQALLAPMQEQELAGVRNRLFQTGRTGLATGGTAAGNMAATNPELAAYYNALARQQAQLAAGAEQAAQQQQTFGAGLLSSGGQLLGQVPALTTAAYSPLSTQLGLAGTVENLGQEALDIGSALGGRVTSGNAAAGALLGQGMSNAAQTLQATQAANPFATALQGLSSNQQFTSGVGNWFNNLITPTPYSGRGTIYSNDPGTYSGFDY